MQTRKSGSAELAPMDSLADVLAGIDVRFADYGRAVFLNVIVTEYSKPVFNDRYGLMRIDHGCHPAFRQFEEKNDILVNGSFILAYRRNLPRMPFDRFAAYLHNRYADSMHGRKWSGNDRISQWLNYLFVEMPEPATSFDIEFDNIAIMETDLQNGGYERYPGNRINIDVPLDAFDDLFRLPDPGSPALADFDIDLILKKLQAGGLLFRGIGKYTHGDLEAAAYDQIEDCREEDMQDYVEAAAVRRLRSKCGDDPLQALVSFHFGGGATRLLDFTEDPMAALHDACAGNLDMNLFEQPAEILLLAESDFKSAKDVGWPLTEDCIMDCAPAAEFQPQAEAQSAAPVFFYDGCLRRYQHGSRCRNVLIPHAVTELLLRHSGRTADDSYPNIQSRIKEFADAEKYSRITYDDDFFEKIICNIDERLMEFDYICLLDLEINDYAKPVIGADFLLTAVRPDLMEQVPHLLEKSYNFVPEEASGIKYVMGCRQILELDRFNDWLRKLAPAIETNPLLAYLRTGKESQIRQRLRRAADRPSATPADIAAAVRDCTVKVDGLCSETLQ